MKKISVVKGIEVDIKDFNIDDFIQDKEKHGTINKITKKELREIASGLGLSYDESDIVFSKKLLNAYLAKR